MSSAASNFRSTLESSFASECHPPSPTKTTQPNYFRLDQVERYRSILFLSIGGVPTKCILTRDNRCFVAVRNLCCERANRPLFITDLVPAGGRARSAGRYRHWTVQRSRCSKDAASGESCSLAATAARPTSRFQTSCPTPRRSTCRRVRPSGRLRPCSAGPRPSAHLALDPEIPRARLPVSKRLRPRGCAGLPTRCFSSRSPSSQCRGARTLDPTRGLRNA
jgi:hypothetical protein